MHLLGSSARTRVRVWAEYAPFDMKDVLKRRGYRWFGGGDGQPKAWWTEVDEDDLAAKLRFLEREVYLREVDMARRLVARLTDAGRPPEAHFFEGEGHIFRAEARNREWALMTDFFARHLAKKTPSMPVAQPETSA